MVTLQNHWLHVDDYPPLLLLWWASHCHFPPSEIGKVKKEKNESGLRNGHLGKEKGTETSLHNLQL